MNDLILEKKLEVTLSTGNAWCSPLMAKKSLYSLQMVCGLFPPLTHVQPAREMYSSFFIMLVTSFPLSPLCTHPVLQISSPSFQTGSHILLFFSFHHLLPQPHMPMLLSTSSNECPCNHWEQLWRQSCLPLGTLSRCMSPGFT